MKEFAKRLKSIKKTYGESSEEYIEANNSFKAYGCEAGTKGCSEKVGSSQVIVEVGTLPAGESAMENRGADGKKAIVTLDSAALSNGYDILGDIAHEGVHAHDDINYINSNKQQKVSDYESERRGFVVTSAIEELVASRSSRSSGIAQVTIYDQSWKTLNPKLKPSENVRNERAKQIDKLLAVPRSQGGIYGFTKDAPGQSYFP